MNDFESQKIKQTLKSLLKKKDLSYKEIAESLECSIPTVTRILGPEELTLTRLLQLCKILDINLADLQRLSETASAKVQRFSPEQEAFLVKNKNFLAYLVKLFGEATPKSIAEKYKLTQRSTDKYLLTLERQGLIRVTGKQRVKPIFKSFPILGKGPLGKAYYESILKNASQFFIRRISDQFATSAPDTNGSGSKVATSILKISRPTFEAWLAEREKSNAALRQLSEYEERSKSAEELMTAVILEASTLTEDSYAGLQTLENTFGEIINI